MHIPNADRAIARYFSNKKKTRKSYTALKRLNPCSIVPTEYCTIVFVRNTHTRAIICIHNNNVFFHNKLTARAHAHITKNSITAQR